MNQARNTLYRHWLMLQVLPRQPRGITASEVTQRLKDEGFEVTKRSVERDLATLSSVFPLVCDDVTTPYRWAWLKDAPSLSLSGMSPLQALVLLTAEAQLQDLLPRGQLDQLTPMFDQARQAIAQQHAKPGMGAWPQAVAVVPMVQPTLPPDTPVAVLETLHNALLERRALNMRYRSRSAGDTKEWTVHPIGFLHRARITYLACTINDYTDVRLLAAHRIDHAELLDQPAREHPPEVLAEARQLIEAGFAAREHIELVLRMRMQQSQHLAECPLSSDQRMEDVDDQWREICATVRDTDQLRWWLTSYGDAVEIRAPAELRAWAAGTHARAAALYGEATAT